ncbi:hypothetical protein [Streptomyces mirabilis]
MAATQARAESSDEEQPASSLVVVNAWRSSMPTVAAIAGSATVR